jgi:hypothetical protein
VPETTLAPSQDVTVHCRNTSLWSEVKFYAWNTETE